MYSRVLYLRSDNSFNIFCTSKPFLYTLIISQGKDKLKRVQVLIAANDTWQGIIFNSWPYSKTPPFIKGTFDKNTFRVVFIDFEENVWNYRDGVFDFNKCIQTFNESKCIPIFDPRLQKSEYK